MNGSIVSLNEVVEKEDTGKDQLESAVNQINNSFKGLKGYLGEFKSGLKGIFPGTS